MPSPDISTCAQSGKHAGLPTARLGSLQVLDTLLAPASLPSTDSHATPSQGLADPFSSACSPAVPHCSGPACTAHALLSCLENHCFARGNFQAGKISPELETQRSSHRSGSDLIIKQCRGHCSQPAPRVLIFQFGLHPALVNPLITLHTVAFTDE